MHLKSEISNNAPNYIFIYIHIYILQHKSVTRKNKLCKVSQYKLKCYGASYSQDKKKMELDRKFKFPKII